MSCSRAMRKFIHDLTVFRFVVLVALAMVFNNEYLCYVWCRLRWASIPNPTRDASSELRILLVADPQLVGFRDESPWFGFVTRWDCDRYLQNGFQNAFSYVRPDVVVFLGDLLDEGSVATDHHYVTYVDRFKSVFPVPKDVQSVFIHGDNDVGGENFQLKEQALINRFNKYFDPANLSSNSVVHSKFVDFLKLSFDFGEAFAAKMKESVAQMTRDSSAPLRIVCNHMGIFVRPPTEYSELIAVARPSMFISAHNHKAAVYHCKECQSILDTKTPSMPSYDSKPRLNITSISDNTVFEFDLNGGRGVIELVVPTCSYRMGVKKIGYGVAILGSGGRLQYAVLWLPSRYPLLYSYLVFIVSVSVLLVLWALVVLFGGNGAVRMKARLI